VNPFFVLPTPPTTQPTMMAVLFEPPLSLVEVGEALGLGLVDDADEEVELEEEDEDEDEEITEELELDGKAEELDDEEEGAAEDEELLWLLEGAKVDIEELDA
jgi:hypothetical protein